MAETGLGVLWLCTMWFATMWKYTGYSELVSQHTMGGSEASRGGAGTGRPEREAICSASKEKGDDQNGYGGKGSPG